MTNQLFVNEIQDDYYTQDIELDAIQVLLDIGVLVHSQTTVTDHSIHRYFVKNQSDLNNDYRVNDLRLDRSVHLEDNAYLVLARSYKDKDFAQL